MWCAHANRVPHDAKEHAHRPRPGRDYCSPRLAAIRGAAWRLNLDRCLECQCPKSERASDRSGRHRAQPSRRRLQYLAYSAVDLAAPSMAV